jgi:hypothetical protein
MLSCFHLSFSFSPSFGVNGRSSFVLVFYGFAHPLRACSWGPGGSFHPPISCSLSLLSTVRRLEQGPLSTMSSRGLYIYSTQYNDWIYQPEAASLRLPRNSLRAVVSLFKNYYRVAESWMWYVSVAFMFTGPKRFSLVSHFVTLTWHFQCNELNREVYFLPWPVKEVSRLTFGWLRRRD